MSEQTQHGRWNRLRGLAIGVAAVVLALAGCATSSSEPASVSAGADDELATALAGLQTSLVETEHVIRSAPAFGSELERARGYEFLLRTLIQSLEAELLQDADFPYFRTLDFWLRGGGDNPDQRYAFSPIRGGEAYRVWGDLGSARRVEIQLYAGQPWAGTGRSAGYLTFEEIPIAEDGSFEVDLVVDGAGTARSGAAQLVNPNDATTVFVRHIFNEWDERQTGMVHIDRVGYEGRRKPGSAPAETAKRIEAATENFELRARTWPAFVGERYIDGRTPNTLSPLIDTYPLGGARGRWMANGSFRLAADQALVIRSWPTNAGYQAIQLTDLWFDSLEYGNQVSSLNTTQTQLAPDGSYYHVISADDPGYTNWLDTGGLTRGTILMRYDGVQGAISSTLHPSASVVALDDLPAKIPGFEKASAEEREQVRAARRRHLQIRSGR
jgi:hypothetical protein